MICVAVCFRLVGDFGWDPLSLGKDPEALQYYVQAELVHARFAMMGLAGMLIPDVSVKITSPFMFSIHNYHWIGLSANQVLPLHWTDVGETDFWKVYCCNCPCTIAFPALNFRFCPSYLLRGLFGINDMKFLNFVWCQCNMLYFCYQVLTHAGVANIPVWYEAGKVAQEGSDIPFSKQETHALL